MNNEEYRRLRESIDKDLLYTIDSLTHKRRERKQDLFVLTGQPQSLTTDPIDSWTLFCWMQERDIPSRYLIHKRSAFYQKILEEKRLQDVITLDDEDFQLGALLRHEDLWLRTKAFIAEWGIDALVDEWMRRQPGLRYVFLQHGVAGAWYTDILRYQYREVFNDVNASSEDERRLIAEGDPELYQRIFIAGLPRYDLLSDASSASVSTEHTVFVMMTWRMGLRSDAAKLALSLYWQRIRAFLSPEHIEQLRRRNVRVVFAPHHAMVEQISDWSSMEGVEMSSQDQISYWIRHADAFVTDFSSVSYDFHFQHKPVIYWIPDSDMVPAGEDDETDRQKIDSALSRQDNFYNVAHSADEAWSLLLDYAGREFVLEPEKCRIADTFFAYKSDFCRHVYDAVEARYNSERLELDGIRQRGNVASPEISIIVPVYNVERYLRDCLDSLVNQTLHEIEIIAVNDGSTDTSLDIMEEYAGIDGRIHVIHQKNQGTAIARQVGFQASQGRYVVFVDPDDWIEPDTCSKLLERITETGDDIILHAMVAEPDGEEPVDRIQEINNYFNQEIPKIESSPKMLQACFVDRLFNWSMCMRIFSREVLVQAFEHLPQKRCIFGEDMISTFYILSYSRSISYFHEPLYHYRIGTGVSTKKSLSREDVAQSLQCFLYLNDCREFARKHYKDSSQVNGVLDKIETLLADGVVGMTERMLNVKKIENECSVLRQKNDLLQTENQRLLEKKQKHIFVIRLLAYICISFAILMVCVFAWLLVF